MYVWSECCNAADAGRVAVGVKVAKEADEGGTGAAKTLECYLAPDVTIKGFCIWRMHAAKDYSEHDATLVGNLLCIESPKVTE